MTREDEIRRTLELLHEGSLFEIRVLTKQRTKAPKSGYFRNLDKAVKVVLQLEQEYDAVFTTLNALHPGLYARSPDTMTAGVPATSDNDVIARRWLLVDVDAVRPAGISSTDEELERTREVRHLIAEEYKSTPQILAASGGGSHVLFRVGPHYTTEQCKAFLQQLAAKYNTDEVEIDQTVFNPSRVTKCYGTKARKGFPTADRPHRRSRIEGVYGITM